MRAPSTPTATLVRHPSAGRPVTMPAIHAASRPTTIHETRPTRETLCRSPAARFRERVAGVGQPSAADLLGPLVEAKVVLALPQILLVDQHQLSRHETSMA